ncbi:hypothetical protein EBR03_07245 [bacterium]|nr:hypothetical protein [bacterium]
MNIGVKANFFMMNPMSASSAPLGSVFLDADNGNVLSIKNINGIVEEVTQSAATNLFIKRMVANGPISLKKPVSKRADGKIQQADSDAAAGQSVVGISLDTAAVNGDIIPVLLFGANIENALIGLGYAPGDEIYLSESAGYTNNPASFTGSDDSIIKIGVADCAAAIASASATDLIIFPEIVVRP